MRRKFVTNLVLLISVNLLVKPFWIYGIEIEVQNAVGAADYGFYFSLFNFTILLNILLDLGITNYNNRNIAQHNQLLSKYLSNILVLRFMLGIGYILVSIIIGLIIGYSPVQFKMLILLLFNQFLIQLILYLRTNISGLHLFKTDSFLSVLDKILMIFIVGSLLYKYYWANDIDPHFNIEWFVYSQTVAYLLTALIAFLTVLSKTEFLKLHYDRSFFIAVLKQSYPYALLILLMAVYTRSDSVMLERLLGDAGPREAGIYAMAYRNLDAVSMFGVMFAGLLLPIFAKMLKQKESVEELVQLSYLLLVIPAIILAIGCHYYQYDIMDLLYDEHIDQSALILGIIMFNFIGIATGYITGTLLTANGSMKQYNIIAASSLVLNISLNLFLIPKYGAYGAALTGLTTQIVTAGAQLILVTKIFSFKINYRLIATILLFVALLTVSAYTTKEYIVERPFIGLGVYIAIALTLAFSLRLINLRALYMIVKYDK